MNTCFRWLSSITLVAMSSGVSATTPLSEDERFVRMVHATGRIYMVVLNQVEFRGVEDERPTSLVRVGSARRLGMMLHSDSIPVLLKFHDVKPFESTYAGNHERPCLETLKHFGSAAVVAVAHAEISRQREYDLLGDFLRPFWMAADFEDFSFLPQIITHLEGLRLETQDPLVRSEIKSRIEDYRETLAKQHREHKVVSGYPKPLVLPATTQPWELAKVVLDDAENAVLIEKLHRVGSDLIATLKDVQQPIAERVRAAKFLGQLKYVLAIPTLIDHLSLIDPNGIEPAEMWGDVPKYPSAVALAALGSCATVDLAHRIADAPTADKVREWKRLILDDDALRGVITHLRGMAVEATDTPGLRDDAPAPATPPRLRSDFVAPGTGPGMRMLRTGRQRTVLRSLPQSPQLGLERSQLRQLQPNDGLSLLRLTSNHFFRDEIQ